MYSRFAKFFLFDDFSKWSGVHLKDVEKLWKMIKIWQRKKLQNRKENDPPWKILSRPSKTWFCIRTYAEILQQGNTDLIFYLLISPKRFPLNSFIEYYPPRIMLLWCIGHWPTTQCYRRMPKTIVVTCMLITYSVFMFYSFRDAVSFCTFWLFIEAVRVGLVCMLIHSYELHYHSNMYLVLLYNMPMYIQVVLVICHHNI